MQHDIRKATGRGPDVNGGQALHRDSKDLQGLLQLQTAPADILEFFSLEFEFSSLIDFFTWLVKALTIKDRNHQASHDASLGLLAGLKEALFVGQNIHSFLRHSVATFLAFPGSFQGQNQLAAANL